MKILDLRNIATHRRVLDGVSGAPFDISFAGLRIHFDAARHGVAEGLSFRQSVLRENVHRGSEVLAAIVRSRHVDLAGREVVVRDINLVLSRRYLAWVDRQPGTVDERRVERGEIVDSPARPAIVAVGEMGLESESHLLNGRPIYRMIPCNARG